ncbi:hypothetical protein C8R43DRAFT_952777 [Mycena crocata]|nr:hypothetical protein C8R43DRAFT_965290 [Mycena crocata]KAJ7148170.1 hypothetical protein C8R43DRAFT_952777 [Mycena crocata]
MPPCLGDLHYSTTLVPVVHLSTPPVSSCQYVPLNASRTLVIAGVVRGIQQNPVSMRGTPMYTVFIAAGQSKEQAAEFARCTNTLRDILISDQIGVNARSHLSLGGPRISVVNQWLPPNASGPSPLVGSDALQVTPLIALEHTELCSVWHPYLDLVGIASVSIGTYIIATCVMYRMEAQFLGRLRVRAYSIFPLDLSCLPEKAAPSNPDESTLGAAACHDKITLPEEPIYQSQTISSDAPAARSRRLAPIHLKYLWVRDGDPPVMVCVSCSMDGQEFTLPETTDSDGLEDHSETLHSDVCDKITGISEEELQDMLTMEPDVTC